MNIFDKINTSYKKEKPFVVYRKPNANVVSGFFMNEDSLFFSDDFSESGFVFAPFDNKEKAILFPLENSEFLSEELFLTTVSTGSKNVISDETSKENHIDLVEKTIDKIRTTDLKKIVVSRKEIIDIHDFNLVEVYKNLLQNYKNAFVYVWFHPKVGLWLGATPETLLEIQESTFSTMSLAGTQVYTNTENVVWESKELEEQQLVTDFIENQLNSISVNLRVDKKETVKAGDLLHLRTKVVGDLKENFTLNTLIRALHPTPAVCGFPRQEAKEFILQNELYNRTFYTGFLGELNLKENQSGIKSSSLFVNLRCMNIDKNIASIFVGGGITKNSNATKEWEETVSKSKVMKRIL